MQIKFNRNSEINSVDPPTTWLTFGAWIYMVPQYRPESVLILGYAGGTVAGLIRLLYGDVPITGVDIRPCEPTYGSTFVLADAQEYVKTCGKFDAVVIDLFDLAEDGIPSFVTSQEFVSHISRIANYVAINTLKEPSLSEYCKHFRGVGRNKPSGLSNVIHYFEKNEIPNLKPFR